MPLVRQRLAHAPVQPLVEALSAAVALARGRDCRPAAQAACASRPCLALAVGGLLVTLLNALTIYLIIEFAVPIVPALVVFAAGLVGERRTIVP